jgi:hypothetical protein
MLLSRGFPLVVVQHHNCPCHGIGGSKPFLRSTAVASADASSVDRVMLEFARQQTYQPDAQDIDDIRQCNDGRISRAIRYGRDHVADRH